MFVTYCSFIQFKSVPDPGDGISANGGDNESGQYDYFSYTEVKIKLIVHWVFFLVTRP